MKTSYKESLLGGELFQKVRDGRPRAIARVITYVENYEEASELIVSNLYPDTGSAHIIGVTGPPGSGKSTLVNELAKEIRSRGSRVGILAVDPSSPFSGGAILGDRVRMQDLSGDEGIFIRSMASRGSLGGLAMMTGDVVKILDAAGYEIILVETVGAGQAEVDIASTAHTTLVVEAPGMGDDIQTIKAGILEIADLLVVNKADRPGSDRTIAGLKTMLQMGNSSGPALHHGRLIGGPNRRSTADKERLSWPVPVMPTVATNGKGVPELVDRIVDHRHYLQESGEWRERELNRSRQEIEKLLKSQFMRQMTGAVSKHDRDQLVQSVADRSIDPYAAVKQIFSELEGNALVTSS